MGGGDDADDDHRSEDGALVVRYVDDIPLSVAKKRRSGHPAWGSKGGMTMPTTVAGNPSRLGRQQRRNWSSANYIIALGKERFCFGSVIARGAGLRRSGGPSRCETTWALNSVAAEMAGNDIQGSENCGGATDDDSDEQAVKIPRKFKPYPFEVSKFSPETNTQYACIHPHLPIFPFSSVDA